jgi:hypothetical protein
MQLLLGLEIDAPPEQKDLADELQTDQSLLCGCKVHPDVFDNSIWRSATAYRSMRACRGNRRTSRCRLKLRYWEYRLLSKA